METSRRQQHGAGEGNAGITDHAYTEIAGFVKGELKEGDELIVRSVMPKSTAPEDREFGAENLPAY